VLVVDNDVLESGRSVVNEIAPMVSYRTAYVVAPERGLSYARNAALDNALETDTIAFIDDDEVAHPGWLDQLVLTRRLYAADVVTGPVISQFSCPPPDWVVKGGFFDRPRPASGSRLSEARTGNVLISSASLKNTGIRFDPQFNLSGGEDADFFRRLNAAGMKIVAADSAIVYETVPVSRISACWVSLRALRIGNSDGHQVLKRSPSVRTRMALLASGVARMVFGAALSVASPPFGKHVLVRNAQRMCRGVGTMMASLGMHYNPYNRAPIDTGLTPRSTCATNPGTKPSMSVPTL